MTIALISVTLNLLKYKTTTRRVDGVGTIQIEPLIRIHISLTDFSHYK